MPKDQLLPHTSVGVLWDNMEFMDPQLAPLLGIIMHHRESLNPLSQGQTALADRDQNFLVYWSVFCVPKDSYYLILLLGYCETKWIFFFNGSIISGYIPCYDQASQRYINPFPNKPWILRVYIIRLLKTLWEKEKLLVTSNFFFSHSVFYPSRELSAIFIKVKIVACQLF